MPIKNAIHSQQVYDPTDNPSWQSRNFAWSGCNRDVREAFLCIRFVEPGRSIWHLFQTDFTEIMLLF